MARVTAGVIALLVFIIILLSGGMYMTITSNQDLKADIAELNNSNTNLLQELANGQAQQQIENNINALPEPELTYEFERVFQDKPSASTVQDCGELYTDCDNEGLTPFERGEKKPSERQSLEAVLPRAKWCEDQALDLYQYRQCLLGEGGYR